MFVLGIESTCDETACAVVKDGRQILSNVVSSQIDLQKQFGGVVPELASRRHVEVILPVIQQALDEAGVTLEQIDLIAAAYGPGLIGALLVGLNTAKAIALALDKPFIGINHIEAHLYAALMSHPEGARFPALGVVLSGGHSSLVRIEALGRYALISETIDDAIGEAFDKVAKILNLPYPGGPEVEKLALSGNNALYALKAGQVKGKPYHFSFSGLKTGVLTALQREGDRLDRAGLAASFQTAAFSDVVKKTLAAAKEYGCQTILFGGGVTNNRYLRAYFAKEGKEFDLLFPSAELTLDNGAMIAGLAYHRYLEKGADPLNLEASPRIIGFPY